MEAELPRYRCHKEVHALKIARVAGTLLVPADPRFAPFDVPEGFVERHRPEAGGYYVVYADGYASFSPGKAFEEGYTRCP